ncbi:unnamed protein product [Cladocopium goreaui]|uniref:Uncharacterized protein n=1 Tax=Cladocopium goreaui TaxID=2562237 RepID=A0A9P1BJB9_9DINO|nr:unnamed protein product [Cladocopium goreaui]
MPSFAQRTFACSGGCPGALGTVLVLWLRTPPCCGVRIDHGPPTLKEAVESAPVTLKDKFEAVKEDIKVYTAMWGHCPSELGSLHFDDPYTQSFTYGLGCNIKALCHCQHNPILTCATNSYVWKIPDAVEPFTKTFGYCRVAPWVFITLAGLGVLLIALIIFCARKRRALG